LPDLGVHRGHDPKKYYALMKRIREEADAYRELIDPEAAQSWRFRVRFDAAFRKEESAAARPMKFGLLAAWGQQTSDGSLSDVVS
jgi:hypothetical protein